MSKLLRAKANDDHTLLIEFEYGNKVLFDMKELVKTMPYGSLNDLGHLRAKRIKAKNPGAKSSFTKIT